MAQRGRPDVDDQRGAPPPEPTIADAVDGVDGRAQRYVAALTEPVALALTLWAEARNQPIEGIVGPACVIRNRLAAYPRYRAIEQSYRGVVLAPSQFSCWTPSDTDQNHMKLLTLARRIARGEELTDPAWLECLWVAAGTIDGRIRDRTHGATHYLAQRLYRDNPPIWATRMRWVADLGSHVFLVERPEPAVT